MSPEPIRDDRRRDSLSLIIIGTFFAFFSLLVLAGTFWEHRPRAVVVNIAAGCVLLLIGCGMVAFGCRLRRRVGTACHPPEPPSGGDR